MTDKDQKGEGLLDEQGIEAYKCSVRCRNVCAIHTDVPGYVGLIAQGRYDEAYRVIRDTNPFPSVCGRVCHHPCEGKCQRNRLDAPVAIDALKRFAADYAMASGKKLPATNMQPNGKRVAIVGAGPVGLTAAHDLARLGYELVVFESLPSAGGMLAVGIPEFRLPKNILDYEIDHIRDHGVEIRLNTKVGRDVAFDELKENFDAVLIAIGAHKGATLGIEGEEDYKGIVDCIEFLRMINLGGQPKPARRTAIVGGGNSAFDAARVALKYAISDAARAALKGMEGAEVAIVYRRTREEMPASSWEIEEGLREGVKLHYLSQPTKVVGHDGRVVGLLCLQMELGEADSSGRRRPVPIPGSEFLVSADRVVVAISQRPDVSFVPRKYRLKVTDWGTIESDCLTLATNVPGVFAAGDVVRGPATVIEAIADGHRAAMFIDKYSRGEDIAGAYEKDEASFVTRRRFERDRNYDRIGRQQMPMIPLGEGRGLKREVELGFSEEAAVKEASRCFQCNYEVHVDCDRCVHCGRCTEVCPYGCFAMVSKEGEEVKANRPVLEGRLRQRNENLCIRCGICVSMCPVGAIRYRKIDWRKIVGTGEPIPAEGSE